MVELARMQCEACRSDAPTVGAEERDGLLAQIPEWQVRNHDGVDRLERVFQFRDFLGALDFTNRVGMLAEEEGHHPALLTEWGSVTVTWWTHRIGGLHRNDFIMAARTDHLANAG